MASHSFRGKAASCCAGTSQCPALWLSHMSLKPPERQGRHQNWRPLAIEAKYAGIVGRHMFEPIAVETLGVFHSAFE